MCAVYFEYCGKCPMCHKEITIYNSEWPTYNFKKYLDGWSQYTRPPFTCYHCGYVTYNFNTPVSIDRRRLKSKYYQNCDNRVRVSYQYDIDGNLIPEENVLYYRHYLIGRMERNKKKMYSGFRLYRYNNNDEYIRDYDLLELYELFCDAYTDELNLKDKSVIAVQCYYLRLQYRFEEAEAILNGIDFKDIRNSDNRRLKFEYELVKSKNKDVEYLEDFKEWEFPVLIDAYGSDYDAKVQNVIGEDVPILYHEKVRGKDWNEGVKEFVDSIDILSDTDAANEMALLYLEGRYRSLTSNYYYRIRYYQEELEPLESNPEYVDLNEYFDQKGNRSKVLFQKLKNKYINDKIIKDGNGNFSLWIKNVAEKHFVTLQKDILCKLSFDDVDNPDAKETMYKFNKYYSEILTNRISEINKKYK